MSEKHEEWDYDRRYETDNIGFTRLVGRLRLRHVSLLDQLGRDPNLSRAAKRMHLAQPTVSKLLGDIEAIFEVPLFVRKRRGLQPTEAGAVLTQRASLLMEELKASHAEFRTVLQGGSGRARIGVFPAAVANLLSGVCQSLWADDPDIRISIEEGTEQLLIAQLLARRIDCILGRVVVENLPAEISYVKLLSEPTVIACRCGHPIMHAHQELQIHELVKYGWILPSREGAAYNMLVSYLVHHELPAPSVVVETTSTHVACKLLGVTNLLALLPENVAQSYANHDELDLVPINFNDSHYSLGIMFRRESMRTLLVKKLVAAARIAATH